MLSGEGTDLPIRLYPQNMPTGRGAGQGCNSAKEDLDPASEDTPASPLKMSTGFPKIQSLGPSCPKAVGHPDGGVREQKPPTTLGPQARDSLSSVPSPW